MKEYILAVLKHFKTRKFSVYVQQFIILHVFTLHIAHALNNTLYLF